MSDFDNDNAFMESGNPRPRSKPGTAPGEIQYSKVRDKLSGRLISTKPANEAYLSYQRWKDSQSGVAETRSPGPELKAESASPLWNTIRYVVLGLMLMMLAGKFVNESPVWGYEKDISKFWRVMFPREMKHLSPQDLAKFDGSDRSLPIYVGIDGNVFDVSASPRIYGPGGSYHCFAGRDAARAFVTGCFESDLTHDIRDFSSEQRDVLANWIAFFENHKNYFAVGHVDNPEIAPETPFPPSCQSMSPQDSPSYQAIP